MTSNTQSIALAEFLASRPQEDGIFQVSAARPFAHDEGDYDRQYGLEKFDSHELQREAAELLAICRRHGFSRDESVLEIGCGTGRISIGLALQPDIGHLFVTDPSPAFCRIVQSKLKNVGVRAGQVSLGVLNAEDLAMLPTGTVSMILLRSVLHHITDVDAFLRASAAVLPPGGLLVCEEPCFEGYMMMGFLGQFIADALRASGYVCSAEDEHRIDYFVKTMQFYCRRDIDKSQAEDKHLFRPDELMASCREFGLELTHYPNRRLTDSDSTYLGTVSGYFRRFFASYVQYCMNWPAEFSQRVVEATSQYFLFFDSITGGGNMLPYCFGTFIFRKVEGELR